MFFDSVVFVNLFFITLSGLSYFASAITEEKEEMTLGLLRMTNLNPLSILLGKSASRQIGALLLLISQVPFTFLAVALGGVTLAQIIAAYVCLAAYVLFLGNLALFFSVMARRTAVAVLLTAGVLFVFFFGAPIISGPVLGTLAYFRLISMLTPDSYLTRFLDGWERSSPAARLGEIGSTGFQEGPLCLQVVVNIARGLAFFLAAWAVFDVFCNEHPDSAPARGFLRKPGKRRGILSPGRVWTHALWWKDFHFLAGGGTAGFGKFIGYGCMLGFIVWMQHRFDSEGINFHEFGYAAIWTMMFAFAVEGAFIASRVFRQERIGKTWSSLAMLPIPLRRIAFQKVVGCLLATWPAWFFFAIGCVFVADDFFKSVSETYVFNAAGETRSMMRSWLPSFEVITGFLFAILQTLMFYHLVAALSLRMKWGALPLSIAVVTVGTSFMTMIAFAMFREAAFVVLDLVVIGLIMGLHIDIGNRLRQIAAED